MNDPAMKRKVKDVKPLSIRAWSYVEDLIIDIIYDRYDF